MAYSSIPCNEKDSAPGGLCTNAHKPPPGLDVAQEGYEVQWGTKGRDDLQTIKNVGANSVRLYRSLGLETFKDHGKFLQHAYEVGLHVMPGYHTQMKCEDFDCYQAWKDATLSAFKQGYKKDNNWHPAVSMLILLNEPDTLNFGGLPPPHCAEGDDAKCRVRAALSAMEGVLAAEKEAGIEASVNMTISWSFQQLDSIDGKVKAAIGYYGFQDMIAGIANPAIAGYTPKPGGKAALQAAFASRWTNSVNTHAPWPFVKEKVGGTYDQFMPTPWFISESRFDGKEPAEIQSDLQAMNTEASGDGPFLGATMYEYQNGYLDHLSQEYGLFDIGVNKVEKTDDVCSDDINTHVPTCDKWDVKCLNPDKRATATATAWQGKVEGPALCGSSEVDAAAQIEV